MSFSFFQCFPVSISSFIPFACPSSSISVGIESIFYTQSSRLLHRSGRWPLSGKETCPVIYLLDNMTAGKRSAASWMRNPVIAPRIFSLMPRRIAIEVPLRPVFLYHYRLENVRSRGTVPFLYIFLYSSSVVCAPHSGALPAQEPVFSMFGGRPMEPSAAPRPDEGVYLVYEENDFHRCGVSTLFEGTAFSRSFEFSPVFRSRDKRGPSRGR